MNFFKQLSEIGVQTLELKVVIKNGILSVIVIPEVKNSNMIPLTVSGTAEEMDEGFFGVISAPLKKTAGLISNVEDFEKSVEVKPAASTKENKSDAGSGVEKDKAVDKPKAASTKKTPPYKHQKYLDAILAIVNVEDYVLTEENKGELSEATSKLLVMDSKNEIALEWEQKIKDLTPMLEFPEESKVEEKTEVVEEKQPESETKVEETPIVEEKVVEQKVEEKSEKKVTPPPAPEKEEISSENDEEIVFDDDDLDMDFEDFFSGNDSK